MSVRPVDEREIWDDIVGQAWVDFSEVLDAHSAPFGSAAMDALGELDGARVLDVGCGTGETARRLAERTGSAGRVIGVDLSRAAIERARTVEPPLPQLVFVAGDVLEEQLDAPVDALYSRFGVMFFDHPVDAFDRLRSLLVPRGRMAFAAWQDPFSNPWMLVPVAASAQCSGRPSSRGRASRDRSPWGPSTDHGDPDRRGLDRRRRRRRQRQRRSALPLRRRARHRGDDEPHQPLEA